MFKSSNKRKNNNHEDTEPVKKVKRGIMKRVSILVLCVCKQYNQHYVKTKLSAHLKLNYHKSKVLKNYKDNVKVVTSSYINNLVIFAPIFTHILCAIDKSRPIT